VLYPENIESKIGFDAIKSLIARECLCSMGQEWVNKLSFNSDFQIVQLWLEQTADFLKILEEGLPFPESNYFDAIPILSSVEVPGTFLNPEDFHQLEKSLHTIIQCIHFLSEKADNYPQLYRLAQRISIDEKIRKTIISKIDNKGDIRDNASPLLHKIRTNILQGKSDARKLLNQLLKKSVNDGITPKEALPTIRAGRMVIPVLTEHKKRIKGFIHDESSTGQTYFIEPTEVLEINNHVAELELQEKREVIRILIELTDHLREFIPDLMRAFNFLGQIDFIRAKAKFAYKLDCQIPILEKKPIIQLVRARHPLLQLSFLQQNKEIVPLSLSLHSNQRIVVISGPNAGGKSVSLKTVALLQYMTQCGVPIPVSEGSKLGLFQNIFIDIGDEQSIENDLSTYSSHLKNMSFFVKRTNSQTLFFMDELGAGTEPQFGGAIAESILHELYVKGGIGVVTTHYSNLKKFAQKTPSVTNGAMRFDTEKMEPLYQLEIGKPGSSFSLEIARRMGISAKVLNEAKTKIGQTQVKLDQVLQEVEFEKEQYSQRNKEIATLQKELQKAKGNYNDLKKELDSQKKQILAQAREDATRLIDQANRKIEATIREIKESSANKRKTKNLRGKLKEHKEKLLPKTPRISAGQRKDVIALQGKIVIGDRVRLKKQNAEAEVISVRGKDVQIAMGQLKSFVKINQLERIGPADQLKGLNKTSDRSLYSGIDLNKKKSEFESILDVRGQRVMDVLPRVDQFLDKAMLLGFSELRILHGKGDGILRATIGKHLQDIPQVANFKDEDIERGGAGITVVFLE